MPENNTATKPKYCPGCHNEPAQCMCLPPGETCGTCVHTVRCCDMFGAKPGNVTCDFLPVRFRKQEASNARTL